MAHATRILEDNRFGKAIYLFSLINEHFDESPYLKREWVKSGGFTVFLDNPVHADKVSLKCLWAFVFAAKKLLEHFVLLLYGKCCLTT